MTISFVQKAITTNSAAATSVTATFASGVGSGNLVVGSYTVGGTSALSSIKDGAGNNATQIDNLNDATNGNQFGTFYFPNVTNGMTSVTVTFIGSVTFNGCEIQEWSGVATASPLDVHNIANVTSVSGVVSGASITPGTSGDLIYGACVPDSGADAISSTGSSGFTVRNLNASGGGLIDFADESQIQSVAAAISASFNVTGTGISFQIATVAFKAAASTANPFLNFDWPNPRPIQWYRSWELAQMPPQPGLINRNSDWPVPQAAIYWDRFYFNRTPLPIAPAINRNNDWPNPYPVTWYRDWSQVLVQLLPAPGLINRQNDWPNPTPVQWYRDWSQSLVQILPAPVIINRLNDWPLPQPVTWYRDWFQSLINSTLSIPQSPFRQNDWPNPQPVTWYKDWSQARVQLLPAPALINTNRDWPNPQPITWYQWFYQNLVPYLPSAQLPHNQYDWPLPRGNQPIDQSFWQDIINLFPPPPPPPPPTSSGRTWTREEWTKQLMEYVKARQPKLLTFSEMGKMGGRPRKHT